MQHLGIITIVLACDLGLLTMQSVWPTHVYHEALFLITHGFIKKKILETGAIGKQYDWAYVTMCMVIPESIRKTCVREIRHVNWTLL